ncbi:MAG: hypothetical protein ABS46_00035 [Cytophagaceae bacterium SCN 52-12]|nr:MAG: hypothetical protein ABS46_00035 [Cytophagaceae bacterium SCN 52-12]
MTISGFIYVRNGFDYSVPFLEAIHSVLPVCDEFVVVVGDSTDGTREAVEKIGDSRIRIIDSVWDMSLRKGGKVFAQQSNIGLDHISGDWAFHIQADEVMHESSLPHLKKLMKAHLHDDRMDGFLFPFLHFWGDYHHIRNSRRVHPWEIRLFKNNQLVRSYRDSQGFRIYQTREGYENGAEKGAKLRVIKTDTTVYHYNGIRTPEELYRKVKKFNFFYDQNEINIEKERLEGTEDIHKVDRVTKFTGVHPGVMADRIAAFDFAFEHDRSKACWKLKDRLAQPVEDFLGIRFGGYKNYIVLKE